MATVDDAADAPGRASPLRIVRYEELRPTSSVTTVRTGRSAKIARVDVRPALVARADLGAEIAAIRQAVAQMTHGEFLCWLALRDGVFLEFLSTSERHRIADRLRANGRLRLVRRWWTVRPPATVATVEETAAHYHYGEPTVRVYDRAARKLVADFRLACGLVTTAPSIPVWPLLAPEGE